MKSEHYSVEYGKLLINVSVIRRPRKTLEIAVEPDSTVSIAAPISASIENIKNRVRKRAAWIVAQQRYFEQFNPRTSRRQYVSGETHLYLGRQYRLKIVPSERGTVKLLRGRIVVESSRPHDAAETKKLLDKWYEIRANSKLRERLEACLQCFSRPAAVEPSGLTIRSMKKRWGSMSQRGRLLLNRRLIQAPVYAIDYVITHELCHRVEPSHNPTFYRAMNRVMQDWKKRKECLERILA
jgi:predicted metal-dependent hydrolase